MSLTAAVDLHKMARATNTAIVGLVLVFFLAGVFVSFYFHFLTVTFLFLTIVNFFYICLLYTSPSPRD